MFRRQGRRNVVRAALAVVLAAAPLVVGSLTPVAPAGAYTDSGAGFSGLSCVTSSGTNTSGWGWAQAPAGTVRARFTIVGGGGAAGDNLDGTGGAGGPGNIVNGTFDINPGQYIWARIGCGGTDADSFGDWNNRRAAGWARGGPAEDFGGGGGGGATGLCVGSSAGGCSGGTMYAIAGGGGGGGKGSGTGTCDPVNGGGGGYNTFDPNIGSNGGIGRNAGGGISGGNNGSVGGGGGGNGAGGGQGGDGSGGGGSANPPAVEPGEGGAGGRGGNGANNITGGGGGGGYSGGGGGGGGSDPVCAWPSNGTPRGGAGGGAGSSWVRNGVYNYSWGHANAWTNGCGDGLGGSVGHAAPAGTGARGCHGYVWVTWEVNNAPGGASQTTGSANKTTPLSIGLGNSDPDGDWRTCQIVSGPTKGTVSLSGGTPSTNCTASYTANANQANSNDSFTYRVIDHPANGNAQLASSTHTVTIPIVNRAPSGAAKTVNAARASSFAVGALTATDPDGDATLTCSVVTGPTKGALSGFGCGGGTYTVTAGQFGTDSFTYRVSDAFGGQSTTYTVTLNNIANGRPTANAQSVTVDAGTPTAITLTGSDPEGDLPLTCTTTAPGKGSVGSGTSCSRTYTSNAGTANAGVGGSDSFDVTVTDSLGLASSAPATVGVSILNPDLSLTKSHTGRFNEGVGTGTYTLTVANTTNAPANGTTTVTDTLPAGMLFRSANVGSSGFTCGGTPGVSTTVTCTRTAQVAEGASLALTITVDVLAGASSPLTNSATVSSLYELASTAANNTASDPTDVNHRPTGAAQTVSTDVETPILVTLAGTDPDGDALTFTIGTGPANGAVFGSGATRQYVPNTGFQGVDTFTYTVTDTGTPGLTSTTYTITIQVGVTMLTGVVTDEVSGLPVAGVEARLVDMADPQAGVLKATVVTNGSGAYDFGPVAFGTYGIRFVDPSNDHISEWFDDAPTSATANLFTLDTSATSVTKSVAMRPGGRVTGTVRSSAVPNPVIEGLQVRLVKIGSPGSQAKTTNVAGGYAFELLQPGSYQVWFRDLAGDGWVSEWHSGAATQAEATTIEVAIGQQVSIDELIDPVAPPPPPDSGSVTGTVTDSVTGAPLAGVQVRLYKDPYTGSAAATTDANGQYSFTRLAPASYRLWFRDMTGTRISEYGGDASTLAEAETLTLANDGFIVDATLAPKVVTAPANSGVISGSVLEVDGFTPIVGLQVRLSAVGGTGSKATTTAADGSYSFPGLAPGQYQVWFRDLGRTWFSEWHLDAATQAASTAVTAANGQTVDIDATLNRK